MELVATEEEATEYLEQLAFEEEEEQILLSCCGIELRLRAIGLLSFCRDLTRIGVFSSSVKIRCCLAPY